MALPSPSTRCRAALFRALVLVALAVPTTAVPAPTTPSSAVPRSRPSIQARARPPSSTHALPSKHGPPSPTVTSASAPRPFNSPIRPPTAVRLLPLESAPPARPSSSARGLPRPGSSLARLAPRHLCPVLTFSACCRLPSGFAPPSPAPSPSPFPRPLAQPPSLGLHRWRLAPPHSRPPLAHPSLHRHAFHPPIPASARPAGRALLSHTRACPSLLVQLLAPVPPVPPVTTHLHTHLAAALYRRSFTLTSERATHPSAPLESAPGSPPGGASEHGGRARTCAQSASERRRWPRQDARRPRTQATEGLQLGTAGRSGARRATSGVGGRAHTIESAEGEKRRTRGRDRPGDARRQPESGSEQQTQQVSDLVSQSPTSDSGEVGVEEERGKGLGGIRNVE